MTRYAVLLCAVAVGCAGPRSTTPSAPTDPAPQADTADTVTEGVVAAETALVPAVPRRATGDLLPPLERAVTSFGGAVDGEAIYVLGGYSGKPHAYSRERQSRDVLRLSIAGESGWQKVATLPVGLQSLAAVNHRGRICHFGGNRVDNAAGEETDMHSVATARCLDPKAGTWHELPPLPEARSSHDATLLGSTVYVAGGWRLESGPEGALWSKEVFLLDLDTPNAGWRRVPAPFERRAVGVAALGDKLVVVGGITPERSPSSRVDVLDTRTRTWSRAPDYPSDAFGVAVAAWDGAVYASARDGVLRRWRPGEERWTEVGPLLFGRFFHRLLPTPQGLIAVGGIGGMHERGRTRQVERLPWRTDRPHSSLLALDFPGTAKNRQAWLVRGEELFFFGGNNSLEQHDFAPDNFVPEGWRLHLAALNWQRTTDFPVARQSMQTLDLDGQALALGGFGHKPRASADGQARSQTEGYLFDWEKLRWSEGPSLPTGRTQFGLAAQGDRLWVFGGLDYDTTRSGAEAFDHVTSVLSAPLRGGDFAPSGVELPGPRRAFAGATLDGQYYLVGGMREGFELVEDCLAFDFAQRAFSKIACPSQPRLSGDLVPLDGKLYLAGGSVRGAEGLEERRTIQVYDPSTDRWSDLGVEVPFETRHMRALPFRGRLLLVSTYDREPILKMAFIDVGEGTQETDTRKIE